MLCVRAACRSLSAALAVLAWLGCGGGTGPAPQPLRPDEPPEREEAEEPADCEPVAEAPPPLSHDDRSIEEAENLAASGMERMEKARDRAQPLKARETAIAEAVDHLITALLADPYNVRATYELAAAYAHIGRRQCALNLLSRLGPLGQLRSTRDEVEDVVDRLLGRNRYEGQMDPAFFELRDDPAFREIVQAL